MSTGSPGHFPVIANVRLLLCDINGAISVAFQLENEIVNDTSTRIKFLNLNPNVELYLLLLTDTVCRNL